MEVEHRENMILYNVLNQEVVFEEYFCNLLQIDNFRKLFTDFILDKNTILKKENILYQHFDTEVILNSKNKNYGRADLFLEIDNKEFIFEIKNKDYTKLTKKQPEDYLDYLEINNKNDEFNKHLFFLIPKGYKHKSEILERWSIFNNFNNIKNQIFYWQDFISKLKNENLEQNSIEIKMFYEFCEYWFNMKAIKFTNEEQYLFKTKGTILNDFKNLSVPKLIKKLEQVIRNVGDNTYMVEDTSELGFFYSCIVGDYKIWYGIDYDYWEDKEIPLSILIQNYKNGYEDFELELDEIELEKFPKKADNISEEYFGYYVNHTAEVGTDNYQKNIIDIIIDLKEKIRSRHKAV